MGERVRIVDLSFASNGADLNGTEATIRSWDAAHGRFKVKLLSDGAAKLIKVENLERLVDDIERTPGEERSKSKASSSRASSKPDPPPNRREAATRIQSQVRRKQSRSEVQFRKSKQLREEQLRRNKQGTVDDTDDDDKGEKHVAVQHDAYHPDDNDKVSLSAHSPHGLDRRGYDHHHDADQLA